MITGVHAIVFTPAAAEVCAFFRDVLGLASIDAGGNWPIFALPPAELAVHPDEVSHEAIYLMCDDIHTTVAELRAKGIRLASAISEQPWGWLTTIALSGGTEIALYQPKHLRPAAAAPS